jgi:hypothetical protein
MRRHYTCDPLAGEWKVSEGQMALQWKFSGSPEVEVTLFKSLL